MNMEHCAECGKPCGPPLNSRGEVKVSHWECVWEATRATREAYVERKRKLVESQLGNSFWRSLVAVAHKQHYVSAKRG